MVCYPTAGRGNEKIKRRWYRQRLSTGAAESSVAELQIRVPSHPTQQGLRLPNAVISRMGILYLFDWTGCIFSKMAGCGREGFVVFFVR